MIIKNDQDTIKSYFEDSSNLKGGHAERVALPETIEDVVKIVKDANLKKTPITISGGGTNTTGSRIPFGGIVMSTERLNKIFSVSEKEMSAKLQTGVLVEDLKAACEDKGLFYTSHPTEKTASLGGTAATNASGSRSFKYGPTRRYVKRLNMVLANGEVLDVRRGDRYITKRDSKLKLAGGLEINIPIPGYKMPDVKNSSGYFAKDGMDLIDLFIGQEGTLSVIVDMEIGLVKKPSNIFSCFVFFKAEKDAWLFADTARDVAAVLSIEYFDSNAIRLLKDKNANVPAGAAAAIFFEQETAGKIDDSLINRWTDLISKHNASLDDTWVAMNEKEAEDFTLFRYAIPESVNEIIKRSGFQKISTDIAVPGDKFLMMMNFYRDNLKDSGLRHVIFGHIGESHVHVNMLPKTEGELVKARELAFVFVRKAVSLGGTVSAEHGIGKIKHKYLEEMYGAHGIQDMVRIKKVFDPNCILGRDNIFPKELLGLI